MSSSMKFEPRPTPEPTPHVYEEQPLPYADNVMKPLRQVGKTETPTQSSKEGFRKAIGRAVKTSAFVLAAANPTVHDVAADTVQAVKNIVPISVDAAHQVNDNITNNDPAFAKPPADAQQIVTYSENGGAKSFELLQNWDKNHPKP